MLFPIVVNIKGAAAETSKWMHRVGSESVEEQTHSDGV